MFQSKPHPGKGRNPKRITTCCLLLASFFMCAACELKRPVLYPNDYLKQVGQEKADQDIDTCVKMAEEYKAGADKSSELAKNTGKTAVVGAATGAVMGAISGDAGTGAAIGAAGGATAALGAGLMRWDEPDQIFKQFVEQCLREKGYNPLGWK